MFKSALYALGAAVVAVSTINPAQAANPEARVSTAADVRAMLREDLGLKFTIDDDGDIKIKYEEGFTVWVSLYDEDLNRINANSSKKVSFIKFFGIPVAYKGTSRQTLKKAQAKANDYNDRFYYKFYPNQVDTSTALLMERFEFVAPGSRRGPLVRAYRLFVGTLSEVNE